MKTIRNIVIIVVVLLIFVFFFAGKGIFDDILPILQIKGAVLLAVGNTEQVDNDEYGFMVKKGEENRFIEAMQARGYQLMDEKLGIYTFQKDGGKAVYKAEEFLGCLNFKEMREDAPDAQASAAQ